jgi:hypothetical protein
VNYWNSSGDFYFCLWGIQVLCETFINFIDEWRKVVLRYSVENSLGNKSVRDIEVRLMDTTPPFITKNTFSGTQLKLGSFSQTPVLSFPISLILELLRLRQLI